MDSGRHEPQESATSDALRPNDPADTTTPYGVHAVAGTVGTAERTGSGVARRDPRHIQQLSERDLAALVFIGRWICSQYQLAIALFPGRSETAVSRCVQRLVQLGLIEVTRWNRIGLNMLRLRSAGARLLIERGLATEKDLFVRRTPIAQKDLPHHLWIVDTGLAFRALPVAYDVLPCWAVRRRFGGQGVPVPDLLAVNRSRMIAVEIDLASERTKWLTEKLARLAETLKESSTGRPAAIIVLTVGAHRIESLRLQNATLDVPLVVDALPKVVGRPAVPALAKLLSA